MPIGLFVSVTSSANSSRRPRKRPTCLNVAPTPTGPPDVFRISTLAELHWGSFTGFARKSNTCSDGRLCHALSSSHAFLACRTNCPQGWPMIASRCPVRLSPAATGWFVPRESSLFGKKARFHGCLGPGPVLSVELTEESRQIRAGPEPSQLLRRPRPTRRRRGGPRSACAAAITCESSSIVAITASVPVPRSVCSCVQPPRDSASS